LPLSRFHPRGEKSKEKESVKCQEDTLNVDFDHLRQRRKKRRTSPLDKGGREEGKRQEKGGKKKGGLFLLNLREWEEGRSPSSNGHKKRRKAVHEKEKKGGKHGVSSYPLPGGGERGKGPNITTSEREKEKKIRLKRKTSIFSHILRECKKKEEKEEGP